MYNGRGPNLLSAFSCVTQSNATNAVSYLSVKQAEICCQEFSNGPFVGPRLLFRERCT